MKSSKFPVTYKGEEFRVSVADDGIGHLSKVYVKRRGLFAKIVQFRKVWTSRWECDKGRVDDVITTAKAAVLAYVSDRDARLKVTEAWRKFADWDGEVESVGRPER